MGYIILSVTLGLASWFVPLIPSADERKKINRTLFSLALCLASIYVQILLMKSYGDEWTLTVDAVGALTTAVPVLGIGTVLSNYFAHRNKKR